MSKDNKVANVGILQISTGMELVSKLKREKERLIKLKQLIDYKDNAFGNDDLIPFEIPANWTWVQLKEISIIHEGPGIRKSQYQKAGIQFLTVTNILEGEVDLEKSKKYISFNEYKKKYSHFKINKNDIVTACSGGSWGKSAIFNHDSIVVLNTSTLRLRFFGDLGDNKYLYFLTKADFFKSQIESQLSGQQPNFGYSHYSKIRVPLPPLTEQKRIVVILDEAFAAISKAKANVEKNLQNAKDIFECYLQNVFESPSNGWKNIALGDVAYTSGRIGWKGLTAKEYIKEGPLFLSVHSLNYGDYVNFKDAFHISQKRYDESPEIMLKDNDILICKDGAGIGKLGIIRNLSGQVTINSSLLLIRPRINVLTKYLYYNLRSQSFQKIVKSRLNGATTPHLYQRDIVTFPILLPPINEQTKIISTLDRISTESYKLQDIYKQKLRGLEELKKSLLQKAFTGELTASFKTLVL